MLAHRAFWLEVRRAFAQWTGVVLASVLSGLLLGILRRQGIPYKPSLEMALPVGFLLALLFWLWISSRYSRALAAMPASVSPAAVNFEGQPATTVSFQFVEITIETPVAA